MDQNEFLQLILNSRQRLIGDARTAPVAKAAVPEAATAGAGRD